MKKILILVVLATTLTSCKKNEPEPQGDETGNIKQIISYYQRYSFGELSSHKNEWESWKYDKEGRLALTTYHGDYNYNGISGILIPQVLSYTYNEDGTIKTTSDRNYIYRYDYNSSKQKTKMEKWAESGIRGKEEYLYEDGKHTVTKEYQSYDLTNHWREIHYEYNSNNQVLSETFKEVDEPEPSLRYTYEYDQKGMLTKRIQYNLGKGTSVELENNTYTYDNNGKLMFRHQDKTHQSHMYEITYEYDESGLKMSEQVKRKGRFSDSPYEDWMYITYEYQY